MSDSDLERIAKRAAKEAVKEFAVEHPCRLSEAERGHVHALADAIEEEGANNGTIRVVIQFGKTFQDVTKSIRRAGVAVLVIIVVAVIGMFGPELFAKFSKVIK